MKFSRRLTIAAVCLSAFSVSGCKRDATAPPESTRKTTVTQAFSVPAVPTAPITVTTNHPESQVSMTFDVAALQALTAAAGGGATVTMRDIAPSDYATLPAAERAHIERDAAIQMVVLVFDVQRNGFASVRFPGDPGTKRTFAAPAAQLSALAAATTFSVKNTSGRRCTPGLVDMHQIFGSTFTELESAVIDDAVPLQNIVGTSASANFSVLHFIFCWECPRVTPTGSRGGV